MWIPPNMKWTRFKGGFIILRERIPLLFLLVIFPLVFFCPRTALPDAKGLRNIRRTIEAPSPWHISADRLTYEEKKGLYVANGHVVIKKEGQILYADKAVYNKKSGLAKVWGNVRMETGGDFVTGTEGVFNLTEQTGMLKHARIFIRENHYYISGTTLEKLGQNTYLVKECKITTCDGDTPAWSFMASEVKVTVEGYGTAKHATFRIKDVPVLYFPYFLFPAKTKRQTGFLPPKAGYSSRNGLDIEVPFFWAISPQSDATFYERYMTKRGYMQGLELRYLQEDKSRGTVLFDILSDNKEKDMNDPDDISLSPYKRTNKTRYWLRGRADQNLPLGMDARVDLDYVSDQDYLKEFTGGLFGFEARPDLVRQWGRPLEERYSQLRRSALEINKFWEEFSLQATSSYYERPEHPDHDDTPQPFLGFYFNGVPQRLGNSLLFLEFSSDYNYLWRDFGDKGQQASFTPRIQLPLLLGRFLEFVPSLEYAYDIQWVDALGRDSYQDTNSAYKADMKLTTRFERIFKISGHSITKLRHSIWPTLTYEYRSLRHQDSYSQWFKPIVEEGKTNKVAFSLENYLDARIEGKKSTHYRQWASLIISQGYDIREDRKHLEPGEKRRPWDPLEVSFRLQPLKYIDLYGLTKWDYYEHRFSETDVSLRLNWDRSGGKADLIKLEYQNLQDEYKNISLWADINIAYGFSAGGALRRALDENVDISKALWVSYQAQCWGVKVMTEKENEDTKYMVFFELKGLGQIRAW